MSLFALCEQISWGLSHMVPPPTRKLGKGISFLHEYYTAFSLLASELHNFLSAPFLYLTKQEKQGKRVAGLNWYLSANCQDKAGPMKEMVSNIMCTI